MIKTYKAHTTISIAVKNGGKKMRVNFTPYSHGGSVYTTDNEVIQNALEADTRFGVTYVLAYTKGAPKTEVKQEKVKEEPAFKEVEVSDISEAKQYLVDTFGLKKGKLRSTAAIMSAAEDNGVRFIGI